MSLAAQPSASTARVHAHAGEAAHGHDHGHGHEHGHDHAHDHGHGATQGHRSTVNAHAAAHAHGRHHHGSTARPAPAVPGLSMLRMSLASRLAIAFVLSALVWAGVYWAMA